MSNTPESFPQPSNATEPTPHQQLPELDRSLLNRLMTRASEPQTYYGKGLDLSEADRAQLMLVVAKAEERLAPLYEQPEWQTFVALIQEGVDKGVLLSFATNPDSNVPVWCIDGGPDTEIRKVRDERIGTGIEVPSNIYNTFHWMLTADNLRRDATTSDEGLKGRSAKPLGRNLRQLAHLLKEPE